MIVVRMVFNVKMDSSVEEVVNGFKQNVEMFRKRPARISRCGY